jgi:hypothetical protein
MLCILLSCGHMLEHVCDWLPELMQRSRVTAEMVMQRTEQNSLVSSVCCTVSHYWICNGLFVAIVQSDR